MTPRTAGGLVKVRPARPGDRIALVAPASPFDRTQFDAGVAELGRIGFEAVFDERIFDRTGFRAGTAEARAAELARACTDPGVAAVMAVRGGYGSVEVLARLDPDDLRRARTAVIGYSDVTSVLAFLGCQVGLTAIHGPMMDGRLALGPSAYDAASLLACLGPEPAGELAPPGLDVIRPGEASGPLFGGTLTNLLASFGTPFEFRPPPGHILFLDEVGERPYRLHRMLTQWRLAGRLSGAAGVVVGELPRCEEPGGQVTSRDVVAEVFEGFRGPVIMGFPSGHTSAPLVSLPFGVGVRLVTAARPRLIVEEAAAAG